MTRQQWLLLMCNKTHDSSTCVTHIHVCDIIPMCHMTHHKYTHASQIHISTMTDSYVRHESWLLDMWTSMWHDSVHRTLDVLLVRCAWHDSKCVTWLQNGGGGCRTPRCCLGNDSTSHKFMCVRWRITCVWNDSSLIHVGDRTWKSRYVSKMNSCELVWFANELHFGFGNWFKESHIHAYEMIHDSSLCITWLERTRDPCMSRKCRFSNDWRCYKFICMIWPMTGPCAWTTWSMCLNHSGERGCA